jgi:DNA invertase Pin-like site-specific DNA recombinase
MPSPTVLIYARQSVNKDASIDQQEEVGRNRADAEGWPIHGDVYRDGVSASRHAKKERKDWPRLLKDLDRPEVGVLWLWESSRGDRTLETWAALLERCRRHGVAIYVETHGRCYDMTNPRDWRTLAEDGVDNAYESDKISLRVSRSMASNAKDGKPHGRVPYGYERVYELTPSGKRVLVGQIPKPGEAEVVRRIFTDIERGVSLRQIALDLNATGVPSVTGAAWSPQRVRDIALTITYAGKRSHNPGAKTGHVRRHTLGEVTDGQWPALITLEQYHRVRKLLLDPKRKTSRPGRARHLLSMIAVCAVCDGPLAVRFPRRQGPEYTCRDSGHVRVRQDDLDDYILDLIAARLADPDEYHRLVSQTDDQRIQLARDQVVEIRAHHEAMIEQLGKRTMSAQAFAAAEPTVLADLKRAEAALTDLESPDSLRVLLGDPDLDFRERWLGYTPVARRLIVRHLFERIALRRAPSMGHRGPVKDRVEYAWAQRA